ncbi:unnamed protein product [Ectocarpus sp. 8 AP-2014]
MDESNQSCHVVARTFGVLAAFRCSAPHKSRVFRTAQVEGVPYRIKTLHILGAVELSAMTTTRETTRERGWMNVKGLSSMIPNETQRERERERGQTNVKSLSASKRGTERGRTDVEPVGYRGTERERGPMNVKRVTLESLYFISLEALK